MDATPRTPFPIDLVDAGDHLILRAALPGAMPDEVQVQVQGDVLTIKGAVQARPGNPGGESGNPGARWLVRELQYGSYEREIRLPSDVAADRAEAKFEHGLLMLTLPKLTAPGPKRIQVVARERPTCGRDGANPSVTDPTKPEVAPGAMAAGRTGRAGAADTPPKDSVALESEASFPASDPPSWTPERA